MKLFALICPNGLGHFKRVVGVLHALSELESALEVSLLAPAGARERLRGWAKLAHPEWNWHFFPEGVKGVRWELEAEAYRDGSLLSWESLLEDLPAFQEAKVVLSDNLAGVLAHRPDAVLSGNFLWSDVLEKAYPAEAAVQEFVRRERVLLEKHRPPMLCVERLAMPSVRALTEAVGLGFFAQGKRMPEKKIRPATQTRIAILGGGTGKARELLLQAVSDLAKAGFSSLLTAGDLLAEARKAGCAKAEPFGFAPEDFHAAELVICRPGVGTLTDCVQAGTPVLAVYEAGNVEMEYLGRRIEELGLGIDVAQGKVLPAVLEALRDKNLRRYHSCLREQPLNGIEGAARFLLDRLRA